MLIFGAPEIIHSDNAIHLDSAECQVFYRRYGIKHTKTTSYNAKANGQTENFNRYLGENLAIYSKNNRSWDMCVPFLVFAYNSSINATTNRTPLYLLMGFEPKMSIDRLIGYEKLTLHDPDHEERIRILEMVRIKTKELIKNSQARRSSNKYKKYRNESFQIGDLVMLYKPQMKRKVAGKILNRYSGPYRIIGKVNPNVYVIMTVKGKFSIDTVHIDRLKKYNDRENRQYYPKDEEMPILDAINSHEEERDNQEMPELISDNRILSSTGTDSETEIYDINKVALI